ncbi:MAG: glycosyltransferase 36 [Clostridia bacterium]|jgi:cellobiose phosphorylase|nr:glycosyltransferase 36 [Clostridia bacterium]
MKNKKNVEDFGLIAFNSYGGFTSDGNEYHILNVKTPLPWCNVLANENFGTIISNHGTIYTYFKNSREYKLTNWCNDWTNTVPGEKFDGIFDIGYNLHYGFGYVKVNQIDDNVRKDMTIVVPIEDNLKVQYIELQNLSNIVKFVSIRYTLSPVLGVSSEIDSENVIVKQDYDSLLLKNPYSKDFSNIVSYVTVLNNSDNENIEVQYDTINYMTVIDVKINPNEKVDLSVLLGSYEEDKEDADYILKVKEKYSNKKNLNQVFENTFSYWKSKVKRNIDTGDEYLNIMANGWLLYQTICCRLFSKSGFYQSGGAIGYRDQLQDTMALISSWPEKTRSQIILHSSKQFEKGDVLHWWHSHTNAGIKTYFSDDYLWLAYVLCEYVSKTSDISILDVETTYLQNKEMGNQRELYEIFESSEIKDTVYNHAKKSITYGLSRINEKNGLLDIGDGDWNDGFSNIRGQSVWLTLFMVDILAKFIALATIKEDNEMIQTCEKYRHILKNSIVANAWEGEHFVRAFFENGEVLGSSINKECKIDLISQAWAAIALKEYPDMKDEIKIALDSADKYLVDRKHQIVKLLYPPFDKPKNNPGYIKAYVPGTRENGGQYTHASTWLAKAYFEINEDQKAMEILKYINPIYHSDTKEKADLYMVEPFVMAADVYSNEEHAGRGGWTWYTGSSAWTYKVIEDKFGYKNDNVIIDKKIIE